MKVFFRSLFIITAVAFSFAVRAADSTAVGLTFSQQRISNSEVLLSIKATVPQGIRLYALQTSAADALYSTIVFDSVASRLAIDSVLEKGQAKTETEASLGAAVKFFTDTVLWQQKIRAAADDSFSVKGTVSFFYKKGEEFLSAEEPFRFDITPDKTSTISVASSTSDGNVANKSLFWIFLTAFGGGLLALITPCVYSMIPVTVSFFTKRSKTRGEGIRNAVFYAASIVLIFTVLGFLITLIFGPAALNNLATNWVANLIFFALFLIFGISFLGAFEIALPSSWSNAADSKASSGSLTGIFFMALTLVVVSFSCTGPIIGNLLVLAAKGSYWGPLVGMAGFSLALALPFALFAFFPSKLNVLGKAGGWLNAVKVTLGFLELALALKFLSNADLAKGWRLLDREIFIACWVVIFILLGFYLLGKLRFHHDDELPKNDYSLPYVSIPRLFFAMASLIFAVYMVPGMWGAPLKGISAFVPPMGTQDFVVTGSGASPSNNNHSTSQQGLPQPVKYYDRMRIYEPEVVVKYGMITYFDYKEALEIARRLKRPLMLDFTGVGCTNCRLMESQVWSDPEVMRRLKEEFVIASLYVDVHNVDIPIGERYVSKSLDKKVETIGDLNTDFQVTKFGANSQPYYFFLDANEQRLVPEGYGYDADVQKFVALLDDAKEEYKKR